MKKNISRNPLWPDWYNGKKIDEVQFGRAFLEPVSYTHLRAHETDSYLVCRLLLEKKKKIHVTQANLVCLLIPR